MKLLFSILFCFCFLAVISQPLDKNEVLYNKYKALPDTEKVFFVLNLNDADKAGFWPLVKADLYKIKIEGHKNNKTGIINSIDRIEGSVYCTQKKYNLAIPLLTKVLTVGEGLTVDDSLAVLWNIIHSYAGIKNLPKVFEYQQMVSILKKKHPDINPWIVNANTSSIYLEMGLYEEGIKELRKDFKNAPVKYKDSWYIANHYNNVGVYFNRWKKADSALYHFSFAKQIVQGLITLDTMNQDNRFFLGLINGNIGQALMLQGQYEKAIPLLREDVYWSLASGDKDNAAISLNELARCYTELKQYDKAQVSLDSALNFIKHSNDIDILLYNKKLTASLHALQGQNEKSIAGYEAYIRLRDSISNQENEQLLIGQQVAFDVKQKEEQIAQQLKMLEAEQNRNSENKRQITIFIISIVGLTITLLLIFYYLQLFKKKKNELWRKNIEISEQNKVIEQSLKEKETLIKEVHHRVKNNLQIMSGLLSFQSSKISNKEAQEILGECKQRIASIALTHEFLYKSDTITLIQMNDYLIDLIEQIKQIHKTSHQNIKINTDIVSVGWNIDTAIPIGLIVNELISNSYKHAFSENSGIITVKLTPGQHGNYVLEVRDNGKGLPKEMVDYKQFSSMGLELVVMLSIQLNAELQITNTGGACFSFTIPSQQ